MLLKKFLTKSRIIDITSVDFKGVLTELLATIPDSILGKVSRPSAMKELIERENAISTYLESGICVPHLRIEGLKQKYIFVVGRCDHKVKIRDSEEPKDLNTVFLQAHFRTRKRSLSTHCVLHVVRKYGLLRQSRYQFPTQLLFVLKLLCTNSIPYIKKF